MKKDDDLGFDGIFDDSKELRETYHPTSVDRATFVALAKAYVKDYGYLDDLDSATRALADKYSIEKDFLGIPYFGGNLFNVVLDLLGDDFSYWYYECDQDFDKFNENIVFTDNDTHPDVHSFEDLWEFSKSNGEQD